jgi:hypothetical protein
VWATAPGIQRYGEGVRIAVVVTSLVLVGVGPAQAGSGSGGGLTVSIDDATWSGYRCQTTTATITADVPALTLWGATVQASPNGRSRLDAVAFADLGPNVMSEPLLICPFDSDGAWTAVVNARVLAEKVEFSVPFSVFKVATTTTVDRARWKSNVLRIRGSVIAANGMAGRASVAFSGLRNGQWRKLGHSNATKSGTFRFLAPKRATQVRVEYLGDSVTTPSQGHRSVVRVRPKK